MGQKPAFFVIRMPAARNLSVLLATGRSTSRDDHDMKVLYRTMSLVNDIARMITPTIEAMGFELVRVQLSGNQRRTLQIMAEPSDGRQMSVDDCADLSRAISAVLDVEDPIAEGYSLEVSSPGIDRPLTRSKDYERFAGHEAKVETTEPVNNQKRFRGSIVELTDGALRLMTETGEVTLPLTVIHKAKLVLTDALIALHQEPHTLEN